MTMGFVDPCGGGQGAPVFCFLCSGLGRERNHSALRVPTFRFRRTGLSKSSVPIPLLLLCLLLPAGDPTSRPEAVMGSLALTEGLSVFPFKTLGKGLTWRRHPC